MTGLLGDISGAGWRNIIQPLPCIRFVIDWFLTEIDDILRKIAEYGERYGVDYVIDTTPLGST